MYFFLSDNMFLDYLLMFQNKLKCNSINLFLCYLEYEMHGKSEFFI